MSTGYLLRRIALVPLAVAGILLLTFLLIHLAPGDPIVAVAGEHGDAAYYALMRAKFGLDRPLGERFVGYAGQILRGNLGASYVHGRPVVSVIAERLPATLLLMGTALVLSSLGGLALGILSARRAGAAADIALRAGTLAGYAIPPFWLGQLALLFAAMGAGLFPVQGMSDARQPAAGLGHLADVLHHLILPALVLGVSELALTARLVRVGLCEALAADYIRTARAAGLPERRVIHHALRNALLPVVTVVGNRLGALCTGAVLVEAVFAWPGLGRLLLSSLVVRDYPVLLGLFWLVSLTVVLANLFTDLAYAWLDPRVRYR
jgi:peptide/nickel transport system permease protein